MKRISEKSGFIVLSPDLGILTPALFYISEHDPAYEGRQNSSVNGSLNRSYNHLLFHYLLPTPLLHLCIMKPI